MKVCYKCQQEIQSEVWSCNTCGVEPDRINNFPCFASEFFQENDSYDASNFEILKRSATHFWFKGRNKLIIQAIKKHYSDAKTMLEIGCGTGTVLSAIQKSFPKLETVGTDLYLESLPIAKAGLSNQTELFQMDARNIPFKEHFDIIGTFDVLEHILEDELVILEIYKALKKKGILLITVPQHPRLWSDADDAACHKRRYSRNELELKLQKAGFLVIESTSFMCLLLPVLLVSRFLQKGRYNFKKEIEINPVLNRIFEGLLDIERAFIRIGIDLPIGSSRFVVALKT